MKRTRQVEVIRYTRWVTVYNDRAQVDSAATDGLPIDISPQKQRGRAPAADEPYAQSGNFDCPDKAPSMLARFKLHNLLRRRR